jgi:hypothetical protein
VHRFIEILLKEIMMGCSLSGKIAVVEENSADKVILTERIEQLNVN